jgi:ankyrin repeat protein
MLPTAIPPTAPPLNGHVGVVRQLLALDNVHPNTKDEDGWTPLMIAADKGHESVVRLLLQQQDVNPNSKDENGWTPMMIAAYNGHKPVVRLLQDVSRNSQSVNSSLIALENVQLLLEEERTS